MKMCFQKSSPSYLPDHKDISTQNKYRNNHIEENRKSTIKKNILHLSTKQPGLTNNQTSLLSLRSFQLLGQNQPIPFGLQNGLNEVGYNYKIRTFCDQDMKINPKFHNRNIDKCYPHFVDLSYLLNQSTKLRKRKENIEIIEDKIKTKRSRMSSKGILQQKTNVFEQRMANKFIKKDSRVQYNLNVQEAQKWSRKKQIAKHKTENSSIYGPQMKKKIKAQIETRGYFTPLTYGQILSNSLNNSLTQKQTKGHEWKVRICRQNQNLRKYFALNYTRYNLKEMKSLHSAILQYSKGDVGLLKKGLITVLNIAGILIQEDKLQQINILCSNNHHSKTKSNNGKVQRSQKSKKTLISSKSIKDLPGKLKKSLQSNMGEVVDQNIKKISHFEQFIDLFNLIEKFYFKQAIIDYLEILLSNHFINISGFNAKKGLQETNQVGKSRNLITSIQLYQAFRKRNCMKDTIKIINMTEVKLKEQYPEYLVPFYIHEEQKFSRWAEQTQRKDAWRVELQIVFKLCYTDNQLCQNIYEFYMKEGRTDKINQPNFLSND